MVSVNKWRGGGQLLMDECSVEMNILRRDWENPLLKLFFMKSNKESRIDESYSSIRRSPPRKADPLLRR